MLEEVVVNCWEVRWIWQMRQSFVAQFVQSLKDWLYNVLSQRRIGPILLTSASFRSWRFWSISLICWACFSDVMASQDSESCSGSDRQQTANSDHDPAFGASLSLGSALSFFSVQPQQWQAGHYRLSCKIQFSSHITIQLRNGSLLLHRIGEVQFSSVAQFSVQLPATPWTAAHQASLSITNTWSLPKLMSIESVMPSNHLILCCPLLLLPSIFPNMRVFSNVKIREDET